MTNHPFRHMRRTVKLAQAQISILLAVEGLGYIEKDYALFYVMLEMGKQTEGRTYPQQVGELVAWLKFYGRLIDKIVPLGGDFVKQCEIEWAKLAENYQDLLEIPVKDV